jgi:hypothetical protein
MFRKSSKNVRDLLPWYINGTLTAQERQAVESLLKADATFKAEWESLSRLKAVLAERPSPMPSPIPRQRILARIRQVDSTRPDPGRRILLALNVTAIVSFSVAILLLLWLAIKPGIVLQWSVANAGISAFRVYRAPTGGARYDFLGEVSARGDFSQYTYVDAFLLPGQSFDYIVEGVGATGQIALSESVAGNALEALPGQVTLVIVSLVLSCGLVWLLPGWLASSKRFVGTLA